MNVEELLNLDRPLTDEETDFLEQETLSLARKLNDEVARITKDLDPNDPDVRQLLNHTANTLANVEAAVEITAEEKVTRAFVEMHQPEPEEKPYDWEKLPLYTWCNEFARVVGRLLSSMHKRYHLHVHMLIGQAMLLTNCVPGGYRDLAPGQTVSREELRAYRSIGYANAERTLEALDELSRTTGYCASDVAHGRKLMRQIRDQFAADMHALENEASTLPN